MTHSCRVLLIVLSACWISPAIAESVYVVDKLLVGVHQDKDLDSPILKVLPTGTQLEVLERDGELAFVEDPEQVRGWVDVAYLTADRPAQLRVAELEKENASLRTQVKTLEQRPAGTTEAAGGDIGEAQTRIAALTRENTELKGKLSDVRLQAGKFQSEVSALRAEVQAQETPPDVRVTELERARDELAVQLEAAGKRIAQLEARESKDDAAVLVPMVLEAYAVPLLIGLGVLIVLSFGFGVYVVDALNRRRHGGFRV